MGYLILALLVLVVMEAWMICRYESALRYISHYHGESPDAIKHAALAYEATHWGYKA